MLRSRSQEQQKGFGIMDVPAVEENSPFDRNQLILIFVFINCYNVVGYKGDKGAYERRRCWYRQLQTQLEFPPSLLLDEYPNFKEYQAKMGKILMAQPEWKKLAYSKQLFIYEGCSSEEYKYIGGLAEFATLLKQRYQIYDGDCEF